MTAPQHQGQGDPFAPVPITFSAGLPGARHLEGRVIIVKPVRVDETTLGFDKKTPTPTLIADIIVVDGGPIVYGDQVTNTGQQTKAPTHRVDTPAMFRGWMDSHPFIVNPCRDMLRAGQPVTVGIIERGTQGNRPYFLTETHTDVDRKPRTDPSFAARRTNAINLFNAFQTGQWQPPTPVELNPQPVAVAQPAGAWQAQGGYVASNPAAQQAFAAQPAPVSSWGQGQQVAQTVAAGGWGAPQPSAAAASVGGWQAQQPGAYQQPNPQPSAAPQTVGRDLSVPAPGFESLWQGMSEQQRAQVWAAQPSQPAQQFGNEPMAPAPQATPWG